MANTQKLPDKNAEYRRIGSSEIWTIWDGEDFSDGSVLLYNKETGEDGSWKLDVFWMHFVIV